MTQGTNPCAEWNGSCDLCLLINHGHCARAHDTAICNAPAVKAAVFALVNQKVQISYPWHEETQGGGGNGG